jgi:hypothetical protein
MLEAGAEVGGTWRFNSYPGCQFGPGLSTPAERSADARRDGGVEEKGDEERREGEEAEGQGRHGLHLVDLGHGDGQQGEEPEEEGGVEPAHPAGGSAPRAGAQRQRLQQSHHPVSRQEDEALRGRRQHPPPPRGPGHEAGAKVDQPPEEGPEEEEAGEEGEEEESGSAEGARFEPAGEVLQAGPEQTGDRHHEAGADEVGASGGGTETAARMEEKVGRARHGGIIKKVKLT